jgi:hypothetical protein
MTPSNEDIALRAAIKEVTTLLKDMSLEQSRQIAELRDSVSEIKEINRRLEEFERWRSSADTQLRGLVTAQAVDEHSRKIMSRDEDRSYNERKDLGKQLTNLATKLAGIAALVLYIVEKFT